MTSVTEITYAKTYSCVNSCIVSAEQPPSTDLIRTPDSPLLSCDTCESDKVRIVEAGKAVVKATPETVYHHVYVCCGECCHEREQYVSSSELEEAYRINEVRSAEIANDYVLLGRSNFSDDIDDFVRKLASNIILPEHF